MELLQVKDLRFSYSGSSKVAVKDISLTVNKGDFLLISGESGCGKTTLMRLIKRDIAPIGEIKGDILYKGESLLDTNNKSSLKIGYVMQNPDDQIVTDKVWHELAFGLENLGLEKAVIRRRVGEMAGYFGIEDWYEKNTAELSGGQKQILALASVMVMQPEILLLDEPTAQLDPIAAGNFISTVQKLNAELGLTVIIAEHRMEDIFPLADKVAVMEKGRIFCFNTPVKVVKEIAELPFSCGLPTAARVYNAVGKNEKCPLTVRQGREFLEDSFGYLKGERVEIELRSSTENAITIKDAYFRYGRDEKDVLRGINLRVAKGEIFGIVGGNAAGKSTLLGIIANTLKPYKGNIKILGKKAIEYKGNSLYKESLALLPQDPKTVFTEGTVWEDLKEMQRSASGTAEADVALLNALIKQFKIEDLLNMHPYDLSGGEQQKCATVKLLLARPEILLLDEPTKGLDPVSKQEFAELLQGLAKVGKTVLLVTHDIEFAAKVCDKCGLLFGGEIISEGSSREFFASNHFYTTAASRMSRSIFKNAVTCDDVISICRKGTER